MVLPIEVAVKRYGLSVAAAQAVVIAFGQHKDKKVGDLSPKSINGYARIKTKTSHSPDFRKVVRACRVIQSAEAAKTAKGEYAKRLLEQPDTAKDCVSECNSCQRTYRLQTRLFDRSKMPTCYQCGGTLVRISDMAPRSELCSVREVAERNGVTPNHIYHKIKAGEIKAEKRGGKILVSAESAKEALDPANDKRRH